MQAQTGDLACDLVLMDVAGGGTAGDRVAYLWDMSGPQPVQAGAAAVQGSSFAFTGPIPTGPVAISVAAADTTSATGPDFRSGPVPAPAVGAPMRAEVVLGPVVTVTPDDISSWFSALPSLPAQHFDVPGIGPFEVKLSSVAVTLAASVVRLTGVGAVSGTAAHFESPLTASITLGLVPSTAPDAALPAELTLVGAPRLELAGPAALIGPALNLALSTFLSGLIFEQMRDVVRLEFTAGAARALSLLQLPPGVTLSVRSLVIDPSAVRFQPTLGSLGSALSTFQPPASLLVPP